MPRAQKGQMMLFAASPREVFREIRNYLAGRLVGATRDETLLQEIVKCLFCRIQLERMSPAVLTEDDALGISKSYLSAFAMVKHQLPALFTDDELLLDPVSLLYVAKRIIGCGI